MRKYLLISLFSTIVTFFVSFYLFSPLAFNRFLNSINPFKADNSDFIFSARNIDILIGELFDYNPERTTFLTRFLYNNNFYSNQEFSGPNGTLYAWSARRFLSGSSSAGLQNEGAYGSGGTTEGWSLQRFLNSLNPFAVQNTSTQNFTLPATQQFDRKAAYLQTLLKDTTEKNAGSLVFKVPNNWSVASKNSGNTEITTSNQNTVKITYTDLSNIDPNTFNYGANNVTKDTLSELLYADVGYSYPSLVNKDSSMVLINVMQKNGVDKVKLWFKEYPNGQSNISVVKYSPVNTVIYLDGKDLYILNANISESTSESAAYQDLSNLDNLIESLKK